MNSNKQSTELKPNRLHIGRLIKEIFDDSGLTIAEFARLINCARPNVYSIFERYDISIEQLLDISEVLNHNFFEDILNHAGMGMGAFNYPKQLNIIISLEELASKKSERIADLLKELAKECDSGQTSLVAEQ